MKDPIARDAQLDARTVPSEFASHAWMVLLLTRLLVMDSHAPKNVSQTNSLQVLNVQTAHPAASLATTRPPASDAPLPSPYLTEPVSRLVLLTRLRNLSIM